MEDKPGTPGVARVAWGAPGEDPPCTRTHNHTLGLSLELPPHLSPVKPFSSFKAKPSITS